MTPELPPAPADSPVPGGLGLRTEPVLIGGIVLALINGLLALLGGGGLDDGFQWSTDVPIILGPVLIALGIRQATYSQATVDQMVPRSTQKRVLRQRRNAAKR